MTAALDTRYGAGSGAVAPRSWLWLVPVAGAALAAGVLVGVAGQYGMALGVAIPLAVVIYAAPQFGAYMWLAVTPLIVGMERGDILPVLRPNEALLALILVAAGLRIGPALILQRWAVPSFGRIDLALGLLVLTGSALPLFMAFGREVALESDDVFYSMVLVKYCLIYTLFRFTITTEYQIRTCLIIIIASSIPVAGVAFLQVNEALGVPDILYNYYGSPFSGAMEPVTSRGTSTIASSFGVANVMAMTASVVFGWLLVYGQPRVLLLGAGAVCLLGVIAAGQFSGFIGLAVAIAATGYFLKRLRLIGFIAIPVIALAVIMFWSVVDQRLSGFERHSGLPQSWEGRIENLEYFVIPELIENDNWLLGVRPAARIPAPEWWRDWVFIESGYIWLLWIGGIPFLCAFLTFVWVGLRDLNWIIRRKTGFASIAAVASAASLTMIAVLMFLDPHLTMRGGADLFYPLLALALVESSRRNPDRRGS